MRIQFLGTGAANWSNPGKNVGNGRRFSSMLVNSDLLIDMNKMTNDAIQEFSVCRDSIKALVISHPHSDHFDMASIETFAASRNASAGKLKIYLNRKATERAIPSSAEIASLMEIIPYEPGDVFQVGNTEVKTVLSNHPLNIPGELPANLLITGPDGHRLFYAMDGSWLPYSTWCALRQEKAPINTIVWDMTCGNLDDYRVFEHCNLDMIACMARSFKVCNVACQDVKMFASHVMEGATNDWEQLRKETLAQDIVLAEDGMIFDSSK